MLIDQSVMAPCLTFTFISVLHTAEGKQPKIAVNQAKSEIIPIMITNYKVWPFIQLFNFYVVPLNYRIVFIQTVAIFWNTYLSFMTQADRKQENCRKSSEITSKLSGEVTAASE
ncbi:hypothetical protein AB6A40_004961 [Gnathostoma spinigerum]|uniref:Mitochondrial inner membrane protein Mpv17 n=1 Tax=Gnathostoma spinigerum TaxID=75299 RepID=A0ABD6EG89_9BILA